jgi:hypothetical protein
MKKKIKKYLKITIIIFVIFSSLIAASISLIYNLYPAESVLSIIKNRAEILLNRKVEVGSLRYSLKGIVMHHITIYDKSSDNTEPVLLKADEAVMTFSLFSLIKKDFKIRTLYFKGLEINCIFDKNENSNIRKLISEVKEKTAEPGGVKNIQLSKIILNECRIKLINTPLVIRPLEGEYQVDTTILINDNKSLKVTGTKIILPAKRGSLYPELTVETSADFIARGMVKLENTSLQWVYRFADNDPLLPFDIVNGQVNDLEMTRNYVKGHAKVTSSLKNTKSILMAEGSCTVDINDSIVYIKDAKGKINTSSANADSMVISALKGELKKFSFTNGSFQLSDLRHVLPPLPQGISGYVKGYISFDRGVYNGKIEASNISYKSKTEIVSGLNTVIDINNNFIKKENIPLKLFGSSSTVSIATTDNKFKNFYIAVNSDRINLNDIQFGDSVREEKFDLPVNISGKISINSLTYDNLLFINTKADFSMAKKNVKILSINTSVLSGTISGSGNIDISETDPSVRTSVKFNNIKIHDMKFKSENLNNRLFGFAEGTANLNLSIKQNVTETIKGNATFTVTKGKMVNTGVQDGLIIFLSELRYKLKDLEFNKIYGNIDISGKNFRINSFIFNSEDLRLSMNGNLDSDLIAKEMNVKLEFNNHFIKDVPRPAVAVFNEYASGKWYIIPFLLNGNITESRNIKMLKKNQ